MTNHTKGPWEACSVNNLSIFSGDKSIATVYPDIYNEEWVVETIPVAQANARLIAAAPDLLDALVLSLKELKEWSKDHGQCIGTNEAIQTAHTAIAKARGKTT